MQVWNVHRSWKEHVFLCILAQEQISMCPMPSSIIINFSGLFFFWRVNLLVWVPACLFARLIVLIYFHSPLNCWSKIVLYYLASGPFPLLLSLSRACLPVRFSLPAPPCRPPSLPLPLRLRKAARSRLLSRMNPRFPNRKQRELIGKPAGESSLYFIKFLIVHSTN